MLSVCGLMWTYSGADYMRFDVSMFTKVKHVRVHHGLRDARPECAFP